jgi:hypothetical protein
MVANNALQPSGRLLAELFRELCRITKILLIDVHILRDDRFYPTANTVGRFAFLKPNRLEKFMDMAGSSPTVKATVSPRIKENTSEQ